MNDKKSVNVDIEYCGVCDFKRQCNELQKFVEELVPEAHVNCRTGRRGSFEVKIDDTLVHSKLSCLAFPDFQEVAGNAKNALEGKEVKKVKEQPIKDCSIQ